MTIYAKRRFSAAMGKTNITLRRATDIKDIMWGVKYSKPQTLTTDRQVGSTYVIPASGSKVLDEPFDYLDIDRLIIMLRTNGILRLTVRSPDHSASKVLLKGTADVAGQYIFTDTIKSITVENPTTDDAELIYMAFQLPDIDDSDNFWGRT